MYAFLAYWLYVRQTEPCDCEWCSRADEWFAVESEARRRSVRAQLFGDARNAGIQDRVRRRALTNAAASMARCRRRPVTIRPLDATGPADPTPASCRE